MAIKDKSQRQPKKIASKLSYKISYIISLVIAIILLAFGLLSIPAVSIKFGIIFILSGLLFLFMFKSYRKSTKIMITIKKMVSIIMEKQRLLRATMLLKIILIFPIFQK